MCYHENIGKAQKRSNSIIGLFTEINQKTFSVSKIEMVTTCGSFPSDLYKNGLQRVNFVPFIGVLQVREQTDVRSH